MSGNNNHLRINPDLEIGALADEFKRNRLIRIDSILKEDFAAQVYSCLAEDIPWSLMYYNHEGIGPAVVGNISAKRWQHMSVEQQSALVDKVNSEATSKFQYLYNGYNVLEARRSNRDRRLFIQSFLDFIGSDEFFDFIRAISDDDVFNRVDCHAARYLPGHFLKEHVDSSPFEKRHMAYVFNFTRNWNADAGGLTHFLDDKHRIIDTFIPSFNSLTLFEVPVPHSVSVVSAFAPNPRYSVTGWFTHYS